MEWNLYLTDRHCSAVKALLHFGHGKIADFKFRTRNAVYSILDNAPWPRQTDRQFYESSMSPLALLLLLAFGKGTIPCTGKGRREASATNLHYKKIFRESHHFPWVIFWPRGAIYYIFVSTNAIDVFHAELSCLAIELVFSAALRSTDVQMSNRTTNRRHTYKTNVNKVLLRFYSDFWLSYLHNRYLYDY